MFFPSQGSSWRIFRWEEGEWGRSKQELQTERRKQTGRKWGINGSHQSSRLHSFCAGPLMRQCHAPPLPSSSLLSFPSPQSRFPDFKTVSRPNFFTMSSAKQVKLFEVTHGTVLVCTVHLFHYRQFSALLDFPNVCACGVPSGTVRF